MNDRTDAGELDAAAVQTRVGDAAPAAIGRFLVRADSGAAHGPIGGGQASSASGLTAAAQGRPTDSAAAALPGRTLEQIVAGRPDGADPLGGTARVLNASGASGRWQATLQLDPPTLGRLHVRIVMQQGAMTLRVDAEARSVGRLIESRLGELRDALAIHGIRVDQTDVVVRAESRGGPQGQSHDSAGDRESFNPNRSAWEGPTNGRGGDPTDAREQAGQGGGGDVFADEAPPTVSTAAAKGPDAMRMRAAERSVDVMA